MIYRRTECPLERPLALSITPAFAPEQSPLLSSGWWDLAKQYQDEFAFIEPKRPHPINKLDEVQPALEDFRLANK